MQEKLNIPTYRAKKINSDEYSCPKCNGDIEDTPIDYHFSAICKKCGSEMWYEDTIEAEKYVEGIVIEHNDIFIMITDMVINRVDLRRDILREDRKPSDSACINSNGLDYYEIDPSTLAIHFPDMIDSEGTKIFASLSEDGKGGDKIPTHTSLYKGESVFYFDKENKAVRLLDVSKDRFTWEYGIVEDDGKCDRKVTGIQE